MVRPELVPELVIAGIYLLNLCERWKRHLSQLNPSFDPYVASIERLAICFIYNFTVVRIPGEKQFIQLTSNTKTGGLEFKNYAQPTHTRMHRPFPTPIMVRIQRNAIAEHRQHKQKIDKICGSVCLAHQPQICNVHLILCAQLNDSFPEIQFCIDVAHSLSTRSTRRHRRTRPFVLARNGVGYCRRSGREFQKVRPIKQTKTNVLCEHRLRVRLPSMISGCPIVVVYTVHI